MPRAFGHNCLSLADPLRFQITADKDGPDSEFQKHIVDADVLITTPFHPVSLIHMGASMLVDDLTGLGNATRSSCRPTLPVTSSPRPRTSRSPSPPVLDLTTSTSMLPTRRRSLLLRFPDLTSFPLPR